MVNNAIGIRVTPQEIFYTICKYEEEDAFFLNEKIIIPKALDFPRQLSFIRTTLYSLICEHQITKAGLRTAEGTTQRLSIERINIEGVIQELFSDSTVDSYFAGTSTSIASRLTRKTEEINECFKGSINMFEVEGWEKMKRNFRESYLAALASMNN